jgi:hypothetical protein
LYSDIPPSKINSGYSKQFCKAKLIAGIKPKNRSFRLVFGKWRVQILKGTLYMRREANRDCPQSPQTNIERTSIRSRPMGFELFQINHQSVT